MQNKMKGYLNYKFFIENEEDCLLCLIPIKRFIYDDEENPIKYFIERDIMNNNDVWGEMSYNFFTER